MTTYRSRPTQRAARRAWDYAKKVRGQEPTALHKNPNCWGKARLCGNLWGCWIAAFKGSDTLVFGPDEICEAAKEA